MLDIKRYTFLERESIKELNIYGPGFREKITIFEKITKNRDFDQFSSVHRKILPVSSNLDICGLP